MNDLLSYMTLVVGIVTIIWFIRDVRRQNSKVLKSIEEGQRKGFQLLAENIQTMQDGIQKELRYIAELLANKK